MLVGRLSGAPFEAASRRLRALAKAPPLAVEGIVRAAVSRKGLAGEDVDEVEDILELAQQRGGGVAGRLRRADARVGPRPAHLVVVEDALRLEHHDLADQAERNVLESCLLVAARGLVRGESGEALVAAGAVARARRAVLNRACCQTVGMGAREM